MRENDRAHASPKRTPSPDLFQGVYAIRFEISSLNGAQISRLQGVALCRCDLQMLGDPNSYRIAGGVQATWRENNRDHRLVDRREGFSKTAI